MRRLGDVFRHEAVILFMFSHMQLLVSMVLNIFIATRDRRSEHA